MTAETDPATIQALVTRTQVLEARLEIGETVQAELAARLERVETLLFAFRNSVGGAAMCLEQAAKLGVESERRMPLQSSVQLRSGPIGLVPRNGANHDDIIA